MTNFWFKGKLQRGDFSFRCTGGTKGYSQNPFITIALCLTHCPSNNPESFMLNYYYETFVMSKGRHRVKVPVSFVVPTYLRCILPLKAGFVTTLAIGLAKKSCCYGCLHKMASPKAFASNVSQK